MSKLEMPAATLARNEDEAPIVPGSSSRERVSNRLEVCVWTITLLVAASVAIPNFLARTRNANEGTAIQSLKSISSAQSQLQATGVLDVDGDGQGEYGFFSDLRDCNLLFEAEQLQVGLIRKSGYTFEMFLPSASGDWISARAPEARAKVDTASSTRTWICVARPEQPGHSGYTTYFLDHRGDVFAALPVDLSKRLSFVPDLGAMYVRDGTWDNSIHRADVEGIAWSHRN